MTKDTLVIKLVEDAADWETGLDNVMLLEDKDVLYHFKKEGIVAEDDLCRYYEYLHHNVQKEREDNPPWNEFLEAMDNLYG